MMINIGGAYRSAHPWGGSWLRPYPDDARNPAFIMLAYDCCVYTVAIDICAKRIWCSQYNSDIFDYVRSRVFCTR